jgi:hypothetical protein
VGERAPGGVAEWRTVPMEMMASWFRKERLRRPGSDGVSFRLSQVLSTREITFTCGGEGDIDNVNPIKNGGEGSEVGEICPLVHGKVVMFLCLSKIARSGAYDGANLVALGASLRYKVLKCAGGAVYNGDGLGCHFRLIRWTW